ncbi:SusC/RagA family TonB-linked outer membrane protein [Chitinophaga japonensis]
MASKQYEVSFIYEDELVRNKRVSPPAAGQFRKVEDYLSIVLKPFPLRFKKLGGTQYAIYAKRAAAPVEEKEKTNQVATGNAANTQAASGQPSPHVAEIQVRTGSDTATRRLVQGIVMDESLAPVSSASVIVPGAKVLAVTNTRGEFAIQVPLAARTLQVSCIAYETQQVPLGSYLFYKVVLKDKTGYLKPVEVVSTGYVNLPKERATGSFGVVTSKELEKVPVANVIQRLEGQVPGLQMTITAGDNSFVYDNVTPAPASNTRTIGQNDYNLNIRGNTTLQSERMPLIVVDGFPTELDLKTFNPNDIEQITFLRDAAAASIWGARAANGVIVIQTKKGRARMPVVNFSVGFSTQDRPSLDHLGLMNATQVLAYEKELVDKGIINDYIYNPYTAGVRYYVSDGIDLAYQLKSGRITQAEYDTRAAAMGALNNYGQISRYLMQRATSQQYNLSVSGGSDVHTYYLSGSYSKERPSTIGNFGERMTLTANQDFRIIRKITLSMSLKGSFFNYRQGGIGAGALSNGGRTFMPYNSIVDEQGNHGRFYYSIGRHYADSLQGLGYRDWAYDYLDELALAGNSASDNNYTGTLNLNIPIYKGLSFNASYALERSYFTNRIFNRENSFYTRDLYNMGTTMQNGQLVHALPQGGILATNRTDLNNYSARGQFAYNGSFRGKHELTTLAGMEARQTSVSAARATLFGYNEQTGIAQVVPFGQMYSTVTGVNWFSGSPEQNDKRKRFLSYYGNAAYTFMGRYTLSGSLRYDDYNNFGLDRKYRAKPFWSSGISWNIAREPFMGRAVWVNALSLRLTYGVNGNINQEARPFTNIYIAAADQQTGLPYAGISAAANPALRWESTYVTNLGLDYSLFDGRLGGSIDVYNKSGKDIIYPLEINPTYSSIYTLLLNGVTISNRGVDIGVNGALVDNRRFGWNMGLNFSYNTNKVTDNRFQPSSSFYSSLSGTIEGYPTDAVWVYRNAGLDSTGMTQIFDEKGGKVGPSQNVSDIGAMKYAGRRTAPYYGAFNNTLRYGNWSLYVLATYNFGSVFLRPAVSNYPSTRRFDYSLSGDIAERWQHPGDETNTLVPGVQGIYAGRSAYRYAFSDANVEPGDYIRLRELSLGYTVPESVAGKVWARNIKVNAVVRNLGLIWKKNKAGLDPDFVPVLSSNVLHMPPVTQYSLVLNVGF